MNIQVSVIMITYNHEPYIQQAIHGVISQQCDFEVELIIADDCSPDHTQRIVNNYINTMEIPDNIYVHYQKHKINKGMNANYLWALNRAQGKYIANCEGDDYWTDPLKLQKQVDFLEANEGYNICFHRVRIFHQEKNNFTIDTITREVPQSTDVSDLIAGNYIHTPSVVLRNNFTIPIFFQEIKTGDWALYLTAVKNSKIYKFNDVMGVYRVHNQGVWSLTHQKVKTEDMVNLMCIMMANKLVDSVHLPLLRKYVYSPLFDVLNFETESHNYLKAFRYLYETTQKMELSTMKVTLQYLKYRFLKLLYKK
jgi:glycosyltransferase involved in cell wall biosynthesis